MARLRVTIADPENGIFGHVNFTGANDHTLANNFANYINRDRPATAAVEVALISGTGRASKVLWVQLEDVLEVASEYEPRKLHSVG